MEEIDFFEGRRPLTSVVFLLHDNKVSLTFTPWEEWLLIPKCPFTLRCGAKREIKLVKRSGIEKTERESFESTVGGSIGVKGIASIESALKTQVGEEIKFQIGTEVHDTFTFDSPARGGKIVRLYQKARRIHVKHDDQRYWHRAYNDFTVTQWLETIYDGSEAWDRDSQCDGSDPKPPRGPNDPPPPQRGHERIPVRVDVGVAAKLAGFFSGTKKLIFADGSEDLTSHFNWGKTIQGALPSRLLPDYVRFLAGMDDTETISASVWKESIHFPTTPEMQSTSHIVLELDDEFQLVERMLLYPPSAVISYEHEEKQKMHYKTDM